MGSTKDTKTLLVLLNFEKLCELPTNKILIADLAEELLGLTGQHWSDTEQLFESDMFHCIVQSLKSLLRQRREGTRTVPLSLTCEGEFLPSTGETVFTALQTLLNRVCASVWVSVSIVPADDFDRMICPEIISAELHPD